MVENLLRFYILRKNTIFDNRTLLFFRFIVTFENNFRFPYYNIALQDCLEHGF